MIFLGHLESRGFWAYNEVRDCGYQIVDIIWSWGRRYIKNAWKPEKRTTKNLRFLCWKYTKYASTRGRISKTVLEALGETSHQCILFEFYSWLGRHSCIFSTLFFSNLEAAFLSGALIVLQTTKYFSSLVMRKAEELYEPVCRYIGKIANEHVQILWTFQHDFDHNETRTKRIWEKKKRKFVHHLL